MKGGLSPLWREGRGLFSIKYCAESYNGYKDVTDSGMDGAQFDIRLYR